MVNWTRWFKETAELWKEKYGEEYVDENTNYKGRIGDNVERVFGDSRTKTILHDYPWRESFVGRATGCNSCTAKTYAKMHSDCRKKLAKAVRVARGGQVRGGACAALYSLGYIGASTMGVQPGGACGAFMGSAHGGCGCGTGGVFAAECVASGCGAGVVGGDFVGAGWVGAGCVGGGCGGGGYGGC